jgi:hypothetical protein
MDGRSSAAEQEEESMDDIINLEKKILNDFTKLQTKKYKQRCDKSIPQCLFL